jgi:hypothetical protein
VESSAVVVSIHKASKEDRFCDDSSAGSREKEEKSK